MLSNHLSRFLRDERGSYTVWSLVWFMLYVAIGGLAVDMTDAYRNQTLLQSTADAAALAGVMSLPDDVDAVAQALNYAADNMGQNPHGIVLTAEDVFVGTWNFASESFTADTSDPNAVYVITRRAEQNANPLALNFLRILALFGFNPQWNINTDAVAVQGVDVCHMNGLIAGGQLDIKTHTRFHWNICLIGNQGMLHRDNRNEFDDGVYAGVGCSAGSQNCIGPSENVAFRNDDFNNAFDLANGGNYNDPTTPANAYKVGDYIDAVLDIPNYSSFDEFETIYNEEIGVDYSGYEYLSDPATGEVNYYSGSSLPDTIEPYTVYDIDCGGNLDLSNGTYEHVAIIADCTLKLGGDYEMSNVLIASTHTGEGHSLHASGHTDLGAPDCGEGGVEIYTLGDIHFAAAGNITNTRILSAGDVDFAAKAQGPVGVHIEAQGDIFAASGSTSGADFGLCPNEFKNGATVLSYSLVR